VEIQPNHCAQWEEDRWDEWTGMAARVLEIQGAYALVLTGREDTPARLRQELHIHRSRLRTGIAL
jgi:hypothetical protein